MKRNRRIIALPIYFHNFSNCSHASPKSLCGILQWKITCSFFLSLFSASSFGISHIVRTFMQKSLRPFWESFFAHSFSFIVFQKQAQCNNEHGNGHSGGYLSFRKYNDYSRTKRIMSTQRRHFLSFWMHSVLMMISHFLLVKKVLFGEIKMSFLPKMLFPLASKW